MKHHEIRLGQIVSSNSTTITNSNSTATSSNSTTIINSNTTTTVRYCWQE